MPLVRTWAWSALVWLTVFPVVGLLVSIKFHSPHFLDGTPALTFGRLRPVHVNGVIFGSFSTVFLGLLHYFVPILCGIRLYKERWGWASLLLWNVFLVAGAASLLLGYNLGFEAGEFEWPLNLLRGIVIVMVAVQVLVTIYRRREPRLYVSLWYTIAALVWTVLNLVLGGAVLPYTDVTGVNSAAMHGLYIHYIVGLWLTPAGLALIYYFLPVSAHNALYSHKLSLLGFWTLALVYPFVGTHHYLFSPIPYWTQTISIVTSMLLIIPVWTVTVNFFGTLLGRWGAVLGGGGGDNYAAKFLLLGAIYYLIGCFQGSVEALRRMQELTHFNDFVIAHSHLTVFGSMVVWAMGALYYVWPRAAGRALWSDRLASWHLWLTIAGFSLMAVGLAAQGFIQGAMLEYGVDFVDTLNEMEPWWIARTVVGAVMDVAIGLMVINFYQTARRGASLTGEARVAARAASQPLPLPARRTWIESPSAVLVTAGIGFFSLAVVVQGVIPLVMAETRVDTVTDVVTDQEITVPDYTGQERRGRQVYIREGCWYCHSQYVRPVTGERFRWGPVSQTGEYAHDRPHLFSTRRIGPDLTRIGRKYGDDWHAAHHWNPRAVVPGSIMPAFPWLFEENHAGEPKLNADGKALVTYLQRLGTTIGDWREGFTPARLARNATVPPPIDSQHRAELLDLGRRVYEQRCVGCHGPKGDGQGPAARFLDPSPRDFSRGIFKFRSTAGKNSLPTDADLYATISHGLWGTAMPPWYGLAERERLAVIQYIKTFSTRWDEEEPRPVVPVPKEPPITTHGLETGASLFRANCFLCHGAAGRGDGPLAGRTNDVWGAPIQPADFTLPAGEPRGVKLGHGSTHLFTTIMTGVGGTPMPPFEGQLDTGQVWDLVHYVQSLRVGAHAAELLAAGLAPANRGEARRSIWASLSGAAGRGAIDEEVLAVREAAGSTTAGGQGGQ